MPSHNAFNSGASPATTEDADFAPYDSEGGATSLLPQLPTYFISHGGGHWPWIPEMVEAMAPLAASLRAIAQEIGGLPEAVLSISGHWEALRFTAMAAARPRMVYDYYGF